MRSNQCRFLTGGNIAMFKEYILSESVMEKSCSSRSDMGKRGRHEGKIPLSIYWLRFVKFRGLNLF